MWRALLLSGALGLAAIAGLLPKGPTAVGPAAAAAPPAPVVAALWADWRGRFVREDGRVVDDGNRGISHSEGQGYGMLLAVRGDDRATFDRLWTFTRGALGLRGDGLFAWRYDPAATPRVADTNDATDGDILIAWALAEAARRWDAPDYAADAAVIARAVQSLAVIDHGGRRLLLPAAVGFAAADRRDGPVVNPSYWVFPAFPALAEVAPEYAWDRLVAGGLDLLAVARFGEARLPPDWLALGGGAPRPAAGFPAEFGWNALRVPFYLAWAGGDARLLEPWRALWKDPDADPHAIPFDGRAPVRFGEGGYRAVPAFLACALDGRPLPADLKAPAHEPYYPATLRLLAVVAAAERYPACL
ncbi:glycosyl hydrolase family 8 [Oharaeibacter diazotrophicus]|uniref:cellulase n=2 Tax=Oharaeibacter diazotrophicus TaxID=1920512 RepID=A0A4R6R9T5_9HYPH|nr:glycosyl hydrolase family 8 [Oharaeibacter diazotrophicus]TDP82759.1 endoglucanase [Oharaeibacter diazotrophicus]BBE72479.1 minor endoglucanase Y precursor [Pleomorphomonas sp. SM30]GLS76510.1 endoglucanase [Oharaeibacter diazotrophicus]